MVDTLKFVTSVQTLNPDEEKFVLIHIPKHVGGRLGICYLMDDKYPIPSNFIAQYADIVHIAMQESADSPLLLRFTYVLVKQRLIILSYEILVRETLFAQQMQERGTFVQEFHWIHLLHTIKSSNVLLQAPVSVSSAASSAISSSIRHWNPEYPLFSHQWESLLWMEALETQISQGAAHFRLDQSDTLRIGSAWLYRNQRFEAMALGKGKAGGASAAVEYKGGILADGTGTGKTATILALILRSRNLRNHRLKFLGEGGDSLFPTQATLIITPVNLPRQWMYEITKFCGKAALKVIEILDQRQAGRISLADYETADIVITTRAHLKHHQYIKACNQQWVAACPSIPETYAHAYTWPSRAVIGMATRAAKIQGIRWTSHVPLNSLLWRRIVLDEVHEEHPTATFLHGLVASTWFGLTGTPEPIQSDIYTCLLLTPMTTPPTQTFLDLCMKRHETISFPQMQVTRQIYRVGGSGSSSNDDAEPEEQVAWGLLGANPSVAKTRVRIMPLSAIVKTFNAKYQKQFHELARRQHQCRDDPEECVRLGEISGTLARKYEYVSGTWATLLGSSSGSGPCPICYEFDALCVLMCGHLFCRRCIERQQQEQDLTCPLCKEPFEAEALFEMETAASWTEFQDWLTQNYGPKMVLVIQTLRTIVLEKGDKAVVFVQHTSILRALQRILELTYPILRTATLLGNTLSRAAVVDRFIQEQTIDVLFLPMELSNSGLNLTVANHILYLHPMMDSAPATCIRVHEQCNGRVIRPTQTKNVMVYFFILQNSSEEEAFQQLQLLSSPPCPSLSILAPVPPMTI